MFRPCRSSRLRRFTPPVRCWSVAPSSRSWDSPRFRHRIHSLQPEPAEADRPKHADDHRPCLQLAADLVRGVRAIPSGATPFEGFPSETAAPACAGACLLAVAPRSDDPTHSEECVRPLVRRPRPRGLAPSRSPWRRSGLTRTVLGPPLGFMWLFKELPRRMPLPRFCAAVTGPPRCHTTPMQGPCQLSEDGRTYVFGRSYGNINSHRDLRDPFNDGSTGRSDGKLSR